MARLKTFLPLVLSAFVVLAQAKITQDDFTGVGHILVLNSSNWKTAKPEQKVGCLDNDGRVIKEKSLDECGTFVRLNDYPYTLSSKEGNCTFSDERTVPNTDSYYGKRDHAWTCNATYSAIIYDELYTINGFNYPLLCWGDIACFYDAKKIPDDDEKVPLWQFRWGSQQMDITPGHVMLQLMWSKTGDYPKRTDSESIPGPRVQLKPNMQQPLLQGQKARS
ncbi:hypothetical protein K469DRAFT_689629 [Zopfia rhizophila CBS 207.26]|uniref:Lytic polysaccharide monooxygenase n=1 Tax=Zopfia rhizophila CBS 207.26 TaxID=1314779 RepID=A0A6A6E087_9PEZI|nr:hypothetical protein K469DRAFT_689629 [Zopfia rhizophila CBS 207.26]